MAILSFAHKGLRELFDLGKTAKIGASYHRQILITLDILDAIHHLKDCQNMKGFHALKGNLQGHYAMTISANYRIIFQWNGQHVTDVNFVDYH